MSRVAQHVQVGTYTRQSKDFDVLDNQFPYLHLLQAAPRARVVRVLNASELLQYATLRLPASIPDSKNISAYASVVAAVAL